LLMLLLLFSYFALVTQMFEVRLLKGIVNPQKIFFKYVMLTTGSNNSTIIIMKDIMDIGK